MNTEQGARVRQLLVSQRWAALATLADDGAPSVSYVAYVPEPGFDGFLLHISRLAAHTRNLLARPAAALAISETDSGVDDPQRLARITIQGGAMPIQRGGEDYLAARQHYLATLPQAQHLFEFEDFVLMRLRPREARFVGGFAQAFRMSAEQLSSLAAL